MLRRAVEGVPMALPLLAVAGSIVGTWGWLFVASALGVALAARAWRISVCVALCAAVSGLHGVLLERKGETLRAVPESDYPVLVGTVSQIYSRSFVLSPAGVSPSVYIMGETEARVGDVLCVRVVPEPPAEEPPVKGMFHREAWLRSMGVGLVCSAVSEENLGHPISWAALRGAGLEVRRYLAGRLMPRGKEDDARRQVLCALLLGAKDMADDETIDSFRRGGCLHAFAVSGLHVGLIAGLLLGLFRLLRVRPSVIRVLLPVVVGFYILLTGCSVSALRAYLMGVVLWSGSLLHRRISPANTWCAAACIILLLRPYELGNAGFLLSFAVYAAIGAGLRVCLRRDTPWFGPDAYIPYRILTRRELLVKQSENTARGIVVVSICAWLISLPITFFCFHTLTPWGFLTNIAISVPISLTMCCGLALLFCAGIPVLGTVAAWAADASAGLLLAIVTFFGNLPGSYLPATLPAEKEAVAMYDLGYGKSCVVLGNPGMLIGAGSESQVRYTTAPALFHAGFTPAVALKTRHSASEEKGMELLRRTFPALQGMEGDKPMAFTTAAGRYTIYPAPASLPRRPAENTLPYVLWEYEGKRTLYVGDASAAVLSTMPPSERRADVLILGAHPTLPLADEEDIASLGAKEIRLLPSARRHRAEIPALTEQDEGNEP